MWERKGSTDNNKGRYIDKINLLVSIYIRHRKTYHTNCHLLTSCIIIITMIFADMF